MVCRGRGRPSPEALYDEWLKHTPNYQGRTPQQQREAWAKAVNSGKVDLRLFSPFTPERGASPPSVHGVSCKGAEADNRNRLLVKRAQPVTWRTVFVVSTRGRCADSGMTSRRFRDNQEWAQRNQPGHGGINEGKRPDGLSPKPVAGRRSGMMQSRCFPQQP